MRKLIFFIILLSAIAANAQQNLVPNYNFEEYTQCPDSQGDIFKAIGWFSGCNTPDYYNSCSNLITPTFGTPINQANNFQIPKSGVAYSGITTYSSDIIFREYIAIKIINSLKKDNKFCVKFFTSFGATSHAMDLIGVYFSLDSINCNNNSNLYNKTPQICNPYGNVLNDTLNWMKISGNFVSVGGEKYLYIGNFYPDSQNTIVPFNLSFPNTISYYYIDDVSVCDCEDFKPKLGRDTTLCIGQQLLLNANIPKEADSVIYTWQDGSKDSVLLVSQSGTYWVSAYIEDYKITVTDTIRVNYTDCTPPKYPLWIPNSFTPNGDGLNDVFKPETIAEMEEYKMLIFNRWGQQIFESNNINKAWDGKYKGRIVESGVYTYRIEARDKLTKEKKVYNGRVTLVMN